jgi:magnesium-transporting ATPase (P-type)
LKNFILKVFTALSYFVSFFLILCCVVLFIFIIFSFANTFFAFDQECLENCPFYQVFLFALFFVFLSVFIFPLSARWIEKKLIQVKPLKIFSYFSKGGNILILFLTLFAFDYFSTLNADPNYLYKKYFSEITGEPFPESAEFISQNEFTSIHPMDDWNISASIIVSKKDFENLLKKLAEKYPEGKNLEANCDVYPDVYLYNHYYLKEGSYFRRNITFYCNQKISFFYEY